MNINKIIALTRLFAMAAEVKTNEQILKELSSLETFKDRVDYAEKHLEHISSGSSRVIYKLNDKTALKLAKNSRGIAQNKAEANPKMKSKYINKTLEADKNGIWKTSPFLDKITEKEFEEITGINFKDFGNALSYGLKSVSENSEVEKPKHFNEISESEMYKELIKLGKEFDLMPGDMERISSWCKDSEGVKLVDVGLTKKIFEDFYEDSGTT